VLPPRVRVELSYSLLSSVYRCTYFVRGSSGVLGFEWDLCQVFEHVLSTEAPSAHYLLLLDSVAPQVKVASPWICT
jgi:hypothetical protein